MTLQDVLRSGTGVSPFANQHGQRLSGEIRSNLKKPVQPEQTLFLVIVAVAHRLHQQHMVTHYRAKITAEAWKWAQSFESRFKVRAQQGLDDWPGRPFSTFRPQFSQWVLYEEVLADHPVQIMIKNTSTICQHIERPRLISIN